MNARMMTTAWSILVLCASSLTAKAQSVGDFDLFILDTKTGTVVQATHTPGFGDYNAAFSPNGRKLIHDLVKFDGINWFADLAVTSLRTGRTRALGLPGADNAVWSPDEDLIAYESAQYGPDARVVVIPEEGGAPLLERVGATWPSWSPNGRRLAFRDEVSGAIGTISLNGLETSLADAGAYGCSPAYSPAGGLIAYIQDCASTTLMLVPVDRKGVATAPAYAITSGDHFVAEPHFSADGKTIVYTGTFADPAEWGLYTISIYGGPPTVLYDVQGKPEYDPAYSRDGRYVVFSTPSGP